ncbi:O-antigen ligase [Dietzia sp. UCD-THP]|uniref:O-antigen ligase family protein n=1 Tax=Dietzia sp. UCD-THP TaxID=1292020 RepID=UPI0009DA45AA|nr:O-antigen ligase family protein [Dietzia sp. UCD-THP]
MLDGNYRSAGAAAVLLLGFILPLPHVGLRVAALFVALVLVRRSFSSNVTMPWAVAVLLAVSLVSLPQSIHLNRSVAQFGLMVVTVVVVMGVVRALRVTDIIKFLTWGTAAQVMVSYVAEISGLAGLSYRSFHGFLANPNLMAFTIVIAFVGVCYMVSVASTGVSKVGYVALAVALLLLIGQTSSDGGLNYAILGLGIYGLLAVLRRFGYEALALMLILIFGAALVFGRRTVEFFSDLVGYADNPTLSGRTEVWEAAIMAIRERPWTGWGLGTTSSSTADFGNAAIMMAWYESELGSFQAHNGFLDVGVQTGVIGVAAAVALLAGAVLGSMVLVHRSASGASWCLSLSVVLVAYNTTEVRLLDPSLALFCCCLVVFSVRDSVVESRAEVAGSGV